ncbi:MAG: hypothetical protein IT437_08810 [Phycisphaerales bacterium]|nr:hypothetical protein [Phycisphaerales bacterium]
MNPLLIAIGVVLVGSAISLLLSDEKSWGLAIAKGVGMQAIIGLLVSAVHLGVQPAKGEPPPTLTQRIWRSVEGVPAHTGGWTAIKVYDNITDKDGHKPGIETYLMVLAAQVLLVGVVAAWRMMKEDATFDALLVLLWGLLLANAVVSAMWGAWWGGSP